MGANSKIEWCHHTMNPWRGCARVHTGCINCYAERMSKRNPSVLGVWGPQGTRVVAADYARLASLASELKEQDERLKRIKAEAETIQRKYRQVMG